MQIMSCLRQTQNKENNQSEVSLTFRKKDK